VGLSCPCGVQLQPLIVTEERYGLLAVGPSRRSQSCASRAKSRAKSAKHHKGLPARRGPERLTQSQIVDAKEAPPGANRGPVRDPGHPTMFATELPTAGDRQLAQRGGRLAEVADRPNITPCT
jgi:hypothetical protein